MKRFSKISILIFLIIQIFSINIVNAQTQNIEIIDNTETKNSLTDSLDSSITQIQYIEDNMENFTKQYGEDSSEVRQYKAEIDILKNDSINLLEQIVLIDGQSIDIDRYKQLGELLGDKEGKINIYINGRKPTFEQNVLPYIENGRTLVPFRVIAENMGAEVLWNAEKKSVTVKKDKTDILLFIGLRIAYVNGEPYSLDVPAKIINDRTVVPLRFIAETLEGEVKWVPSGRIVIISYDDKVIEPISIEQDFKVSCLKDTFSLGDWDDKINLQAILGELLSEEIGQLDAGADTLTGLYIKTQKYFGIELELMSPEDNGETFFIDRILITGKDYTTARGIKVGDSCNKIVENYNYEVQDHLNGYDERNHIYDIRDKSGVYSIAFEVEYGTVKSISLQMIHP